MIYFEKISSLTFFIGLIKADKLFEVFKGNGSDIFYVDATPLAEKLVFPMLRLWGIKICRLDFKMCDIKDERGELVRLRIPRSDLFEIQKKIMGSEAYKALYHETWRQGRIEEFIVKGLIYRSIQDEESVGRLLFIIEVIAWHMCYHKYKKSVLIIRDLPWFEIYEDYALERSVKLFRAKDTLAKLFKRSFYYNFLINYPWLYGMLKNFKYGQFSVNGGIKENSLPKLYVEGRGDVNLECNGEHSDFFWQFNSEFPKANILYKHQSEIERKYLESHGIHSIGEGCVLDGEYQRGYKKPRLRKNGRFKEEFKAIRSIASSYDLGRFNWGSFFHTYKVKVFLTWDKYTNHQMAIADAVVENGGISAIWQMAFDGYGDAECKCSADIVFSYSNYSHQIEKKIGSSIKYNVITGYPKDYVPPLKKKQAYDVREKMRANGAEKIVFVIDENSVDDERWHTGHGFQRENYSFILERLLDTSWMGVIFKPKVARTLRSRLGGVAELLAKAERTGRCYVYDDSGRHTTSSPPILAGLSADICIHGHLSSGTAALECALEGLPTLLIDREGCPNSKLYELPEGKVVFKSWSAAIDAVIEHFNTPEGISGFGDWSSIIDELDPFRDGKAAYRIGTYLHWLIQGFEKGMEREEIMASTAERYRKQWGADKVLSI